MSLRVCIEPGCPELVEQGARKGRCTRHQRAQEAARGTAHRRGYDATHRSLREAWQARIARGDVVNCWRCGERIQPGDQWDLGHDDAHRSITRGPEHANRCNRSSAGRRGADAARGR